MVKSYTKKGGRSYSSTHGVAMQRKFNGKTFRAETSARTKRNANETAKGLRERGYNVRIVKAKKSGAYVLYTDFVGRGKR